MGNTVNAILRFLDGFPWEDVEEAFGKMKQDVEEKHATYREEAMKEFLEGGWQAHEGDPPKGFEWQIVSGQLYVRDPKMAKLDASYKENKVTAVSKRKKKTDTSVAKVDELVCPKCISGMYKEYICPACDDGKKGYRVRLLCGECEYTKLL